MNKKIMIIFNTRERAIDYMNLLKEKYRFGLFSYSSLHVLHIHEYEIYFSYRDSIRCECKKDTIKYHVGKHEDLSSLINLFKYMEMHYDIFRIVNDLFSFSRNFSYIKFDRDEIYSLILNLDKTEMTDFIFNEMWNNNSIITCIVKKNFNANTIIDYRKMLLGKLIDFIGFGFTVIPLTPYCTVSIYNKEYLRNNVENIFGLKPEPSHEKNVNIKKLLEDFLILWK